MRIFIDIGHPAHVHYFRNLYKIMTAAGHQFFVTARQKEVSHELLESFNIPFCKRGKGSNSMLGKFLYLPRANSILLSKALKFKPDLFLSFSSPYAAQVSSILRKPHIALDDTEHAKLGRWMYRPYTDVVLSPNSYKGTRTKKQIFFDGYLELCYLHPKYYAPKDDVFDLLGIRRGEKYVILRFVTWNATHDSGHQGISMDNKIKAVKAFSKHAKVFISSEGLLPPDLSQYQIKIPPAKMHDVLCHASLFFGESATMASESAVLGTPAIYMDNEGRGYTDDQENRYGLVNNFSESPKDQEKAIDKGDEILKNHSNNEFLSKKDKLLSEKIDVTSFFVWFIENYPESKSIMQNNPDYQYSFR